MLEIQPDYDRLSQLEKINVAVVGGGGRERALIWKLEQAERIGQLSLVASASALEFAADPDNKVDFVVVASDNDLADGMVNDLSALGVPAFGATRRAALIEASKPYAKELMVDGGVPTADFAVFGNPEAAHQYVDGRLGPSYVKVAELALGKGSLECLTADEAHQAIDDIMVNRIFESAGDEIVIEELLQGQEISLHALTDGDTYLMFPSSQDHKKADEGDKGPNTGGMGTISPVPWFDQQKVNLAGQLVVNPVLGAMRREGNPFSGLLFPGLMVAEDGTVNVLEYNGRFGDPETQAYMRRLKSDLLELFVATASHRLGGMKLEWSDESAVCIIAASGGYPGPIEKGKRIRGIKEASKLDGIEIFLAGATEQDGEYYTSGGRVLGVTAVGGTLSAALDSGYEAMEMIDFERKKVRPDIGRKALVGQWHNR